MTRRFCLLVGAGLGFASAIGFPASLLGQKFPWGLVSLIVPSPAGAPPDVIARIVTNEIAEREGWRLIAENKPGAIQTIGLAEVLKRPADGHTLAAIALSSSAAPALMRNISFRLDSDFAPVIKLASAYHILVINPSVPARSLSEFVALLKREPDKMTFSSGGFGTPAHLAGEMFKLQTGVRAIHVPYQGLAKAIPDLISGINQFQFITPLPALELIAAGKLRALAVTGPARLTSLQDVPTVAEAGFPNLIIEDWPLISCGGRCQLSLRPVVRPVHWQPRTPLRRSPLSSLQVIPSASVS
jgi:tripartite-type tricarboxylate transporter receptor subunit TctC